MKHGFAELARQVGGKSAEEIADGFIKIAVENMANAIKKISVQRGYDVTRYALNCFGGAGGQHACLVADALGMTRVLIHPFSSLLSAYGMGLADIRATRQQAIELPFGAKALAAIKREGARLGREAKAEVAGQGVPAAKIKIFVRAHIRYAGTDTALVVPSFVLGTRPRSRPDWEEEALDAGSLAAERPAMALAKMKRAFEKAHKARFGFIDRSQADGGGSGVGGSGRRRRQVQRARRANARARKLPQPARRTQIFLRRRNGTRRMSTPAISSSPAPRSKAPPSSSSRTRPSWSSPAGRPSSRARTIWCSRAPKSSSARYAIGTHADPVMLEVFNNLFMSIAEQMGVSLQNTAYSVNIKERLDFSCAVLCA